jgi:5-methylcytosine-specific restriction endonuclease McrA
LPFGKSHLSDKAMRNAKEKVKNGMKKILNHNDQKSINKNVSLYNSLVSGLHNYYKMATHVCGDFSIIGYPLHIRYNSINHNQRGCKVKKHGEITSLFIREKYGKSRQMRWIGNRPIIPVTELQHEYPKYKRREVNKYVMKNHAEYSVPNSINFEIIRYMIENAYKYDSIEFADNMLSRYIAQKGNCAVTRKPLYLHNMECHHIKPRKGGLSEDNSYKNLVILTTEVHRLITATKEDTIKKYLDFIKPDEKQLEKINKLRKHAGVEPI